MMIFDCATVFVNHKPAFGHQPELIRWAFDVLGGSIDRGELLHLLQTRGLITCQQSCHSYLTLFSSVTVLVPPSNE